MQRPFVDYLIARDGPPPRAGLIYDYLLAGDGVWLAAENAALRVRAPVAPAEIRGLPALGGACELRHGRLPSTIWEACVAVARGVAEGRREILLLVIHGPGGYRLLLPEDQRAGATRVDYTPPVLAVGEAIALALHSHHIMPTFFSATDDADERDLGLYAVVGRLLGDRPEVIVRAGAYGHWLPVPWEAVFEGTRGPFRDVAFDPPRRDDDEPDTTGGDDPGQLECAEVPPGCESPPGRLVQGRLPGTLRSLLFARRGLAPRRFGGR